MERGNNNQMIVYQRMSTKSLTEATISAETATETTSSSMMPTGAASQKSQNVPLSAVHCKYVETRAYQTVKQALEDEGRVLICGSPGSGKTYMADVLQQRYREKDYKVICPGNIHDFSLSNYIDESAKLFLVLDDIFGRFSANTSDFAHCLQVLEEIEDHIRCVQNKHEFNGEKPSFKVLLSSRTDIYLDVEGRLERYKLFLLRPICIINITLGEETQLSKVERKMILRSHLEHSGVSMPDQDMEYISGMDFKTLGFPYICKMFVNRKTSSINAVAFFQEPLEYLDVEISGIFHDNDNLNQMVKAAALTLLLLTDGSFNRAHLTDPVCDTIKQYDKLYELFRLLPRRESLPNELTKGANALIGTYLTCKRNVVTFSHPTIHDAVAYALGKLSQKFVLAHCSLRFIVERVVVKKNILVNGRDDYKKVIVIGESYIKPLLQRLATEMEVGQISLSLSHQALLQEDLFKQLLQELVMKGVLEAVIHKRDAYSDGLSFLFWASYTGIWKKGFLDIIGIPQFAHDEYLEAYLSSCISGNVQAFTELGLYVGNLDGKIATATLGDIAHGAEEKLLTSNLKENRERFVVCKRHVRNLDHLIHIAAANGHVAIVKLLTEMGININDGAGMGMTPLMYGSYFGHHDLVQMLLKKGADKELKNADKDNCLHLAVRGGFKDIVQLLLNTMDSNSRGHYDTTPLMYAAYHGYTDLVELLIKHGANLQPEQTNPNKNTSLHEACVNDCRDVVELLLETYQMNIEIKGKEGKTPLHSACRGGNLEVVKLLISRNAVIEAIDESGYNCLHLASMSGDIDTIKYLLDEKSYDIESKNNMNQTPIICCIVGNHLKLFNFLLDRGANVNMRDNSDSTCMHYASQNGNLEMVKILESKGLNIESRGYKRRTPIMLACQSGHENVFSYLKEKRACPTSEDKIHANCLHFACAGKNAQIVQILLDMKICHINKRDKYGSTPLQYAVYADFPDAIDLLIAHGAEVNLKHFTLMHTAAQNGCGQAIGKLLQLGFPVNIRDRRRRTPLMIACQSGHSDVVKQILGVLPSQINDKDDDGCSVLNFAESADNTELLAFLMSKFAIV